MKKIISLITLSALTMSMLLGCGNSVLTATMTDEELASIVGAIEATETPLYPEEEKLFTDLDLSASYDPETYESIVFADGTVTTTDKDAEIDGGVITLSSDKSYIVSGEIDEGQIIIDAFLSYSIQLVFDNVSISNSTSSPIIVEKANKVFITLVDGTENFLSTTVSAENTDRNACIYSVPDITLNGNGSLSMSAVNGNGIVSEELIKVVNDGSYTIDADLDGFVATESIRIGGGSTTVSVGGQALNCDTEDGNIIIAGSFLSTSGGISQDFTDNSTLGIVSEIFEAQKSDDVEIFDTDGNQLISFTPSREYSSILVATDDLDLDGMYTTSQG